MTRPFLLAIPLLVVMMSFSCGSEKKHTCASLKTGKYYYNPPKSQKGFHILRNDTLQREVNLNTNDTSYWRINWDSECSYVANYLHGNVTERREQTIFMQMHRIFVAIDSIGKDFYIAKITLDSLNSGLVTKDTIWYKEK